MKETIGKMLVAGAYYYDLIESSLIRLIFGRILPRFAGDELALISSSRRAVKVAALIAIFLLFLAIVFTSSKLITISGMLFDLAGIARIFVDEEWEEILPHFTDENEYPFGPPSHIMRELTADGTVEPLDQIDEGVRPIAEHLYWRRGIALIVLGFLLQFIGTVIS